MTTFTPITEALAGLHWQRFTDYRHALGRATVPLTAPEASRAAAHLPLAFEHGSRGYQLVALVGLSKGVNHCLDEHNGWGVGYVPAYLRTPPFQLLPVEGHAGQFTLAVDTQSAWLAESGGEPILDHKHQLTPAVNEILQFLSSLEKHAVKTQRAVAALADAGVLVPWAMPNVSVEPLPGVLRIDEKAFNQLTDEQMAVLRRKGALALAFTQMISTQQLPTLLARAERSEPQTHADINMDGLALIEDEKLSFDFDS